MLIRTSVRCMMRNHALGGNGMVTKMKHEIEEIHIGKGDKSHEELEGLD